MDNAASITSSSSTGRLLFVDWLRGWALLVMIETHVFNALLDARLRSSTWFHGLNYINGLVAPSFLFVSGFVFLVAGERKLADLRSFGLPFRKQLERIAMVWAIGYAMHLPTYWIPHLFTRPSAGDWPRFYRVDVLHCIAATWLFLLAALILIRRDAVRNALLLACTAALTAFAPLIWSMDVTRYLPAAAAGYFNNKTGSLFPVVPWSAFMLGGAVCASWFLLARRAGREARFMAGVMACGAAMLAAGRYAPPLGALASAGISWHADPRRFLERFGLVLLLLGACWLYGRLREPRRSLVLDVSRQPLFVYVAHLLIVYGPLLMGDSLADRIGQTRSPLQCAALSIGLAALMTAGARLWPRVRRT